jgi:hypothetical protein
LHILRLFYGFLNLPVIFKNRKQVLKKNAKAHGLTDLPDPRWAGPSQAAGTRETKSNLLTGGVRWSGGGSHRDLTSGARMTSKTSSAAVRTRSDGLESPDQKWVAET